MVNKQETIKDWPLINGDYLIGDPESPVAVTTLSSHDTEILLKAGAAIVGPCKTENLGIEKILANIISNPNLRFLIICGPEVQGHLTGQSITALHENGIDSEKRNIIGAKGAIPYIENISLEGVKRFQDQIEVINLIDIEEDDLIQSNISDCIEKDPGAIDEKPLIIKINTDEEDEDDLDESNIKNDSTTKINNNIEVYNSDIIIIQSRIIILKSKIKHLKSLYILNTNDIKFKSMQISFIITFGIGLIFIFIKWLL